MIRPILVPSIMLWLALGGSLALAQELPENFYPIRPMGLGGAFTAIANDSDAVWTNPAGISRIRKARSRSTVNQVKVPNLFIGTNSERTTFLNSIKKGKDSVVSSASSVNTKPFWATAGAFPLMMFDFNGMPSLLGAFSRITASAITNSETPTQADTQIVWDSGVVASVAVANKSNRLNFGMQARYIMRGAFEDFVPLSDLGSQTTMEKLFKQKDNNTVGLALDTGVLWTMADFWFPTLGVSILNLPLGCKKDYLNPYSKTRETVCGTVYTGSIPNPDALSTVDPTDIRVGFSMTPRITRNIGMRVALDLHHIDATVGQSNYGFSDIPILKTVHAGVELFLGNPLLPSPVSVSMGYSQGFYTTGISLKMAGMSFDFARFGVDISGGTKTVKDERYIGGFSLEL